MFEATVIGVLYEYFITDGEEGKSIIYNSRGIAAAAMAAKYTELEYITVLHEYYNFETWSLDTAEAR